MCLGVASWLFQLDSLFIRQILLSTSPGTLPGIFCRIRLLFTCCIYSVSAFTPGSTLGLETPWERNWTFVFRRHQLSRLKETLMSIMFQIKFLTSEIFLTLSLSGRKDQTYWLLAQHFNRTLCWNYFAQTFLFSGHDCNGYSQCSLCLGWVKSLSVLNHVGRCTEGPLSTSVGGTDHSEWASTGGWFPRDVLVLLCMFEAQISLRLQSSFPDPQKWSFSSTIS